MKTSVPIMTYRSLLEEGKQRLENSGVPDPAVDAWYLMAEAFGITRTGYLMQMSDEAPDGPRERWEQMLSLREQRIPLQHILGEQEFMGYSFRVNDQVLIPRPETELLAERTIEEAQIRLDRRFSGKLPETAGRLPEPAAGKAAETAAGKAVCEPLRILDLCTGSGCIAISVYLALREYTGSRKLSSGSGAEADGLFCITGSDLSEGALETARENARQLQADVQFVQSDLFHDLNGVYDLIVSNPPYIPTSGIEDLQEEVRLYDPKTALDGGTDGLDFYRRIAAEASSRLSEGGILLLEIGCDQSGEVCGLLRQQGFRQIRVLKALNGLDRVVTAVFESCSFD